MIKEFSFSAKKLNISICYSCGREERSITEVRIPLITIYNSHSGREIMKDCRYYCFCNECKQKLIDVLNGGEQDDS